MMYAHAKTTKFGSFFFFFSVVLFFVSLLASYLKSEHRQEEQNQRIPRRKQKRFGYFPHVQVLLLETHQVQLLKLHRRPNIVIRIQ